MGMQETPSLNLGGVFVFDKMLYNKINLKIEKLVLPALITYN
jgi:hypothetical protein